MEQRVSLITLGVADLKRATAFYAELGWEKVETPDGIVVFDLIGQSIGLYPLENLAEDMGVPVERLGTGGATLAHNVSSREEVDGLVEAAKSAGAEILRAPSEVFWGGYIAYFADPDGHVWEIAHNPLSPLAEDGAFRWEGFGET
ncbi:VOC family protein [Phaeobacter sp. 22II1-1F12B]|uniref:VOC family protein n=1 Tax=Phaeobacter sp. 22II1-1F12B TaxID=1317111 RepID=UPI000B522A3A|nr:VOC family protein [Phaeobacter sp. 22II1-1F12B]OWU79516.1 glyoxalase [Phaeobacter sp. 22II1-1F12B]